MKGKTMRLIDADAVKEELRKIDYALRGYRYALIYTDVVIDEAPTIDAIEVVRCADCKCWTEWENGTGSCQRSDSVMWYGTDADDFCSFGERKDNETD